MSAKRGVRARARASPSAFPSASALPGPVAIERSLVTATLPGPHHELAIAVPPERRFVNVGVTREDKEAADTIQAWYSFREGRRVPHWELYNLLLAEAVENEKGRFFRMTSRTWL